MQGPERSRRGRRVAMFALVLVTTGAVSLPAVAAGESEGERALAAKRVRIVDFAFRPRTITVERGTRVRWTNAGGVTHTATSRKGVWDSGSLAPGESFKRVFRRAGTFRYLCTIHPAMRGRVVVT